MSATVMASVAQTLKGGYNEKDRRGGKCPFHNVTHIPRTSSLIDLQRCNFIYTCYIIFFLQPAGT